MRIQDIEDYIEDLQKYNNDLLEKFKFWSNSQSATAEHQREELQRTMSENNAEIREMQEIIKEQRQNARREAVLKEVAADIEKPKPAEKVEKPEPDEEIEEPEPVEEAEEPEPAKEVEEPEQAEEVEEPEPVEEAEEPEPAKEVEEPEQAEEVEEPKLAEEAEESEQAEEVEEPKLAEEAEESEQTEEVEEPEPVEEVEEPEQAEEIEEPKQIQEVEEKEQTEMKEKLSTKKVRNIKIRFENGFYSLEVGDSKGTKYGDFYISDFFTRVKSNEVAELRHELSEKTDNKKIDPNIYVLIRLLEESYIGYQYPNISEEYLNAFDSGIMPKELNIVYNVRNLNKLNRAVIQSKDRKDVEMYAHYMDKHNLGYEIDDEPTVSYKIVNEIIDDRFKRARNYSISSELTLDQNNASALRKLYSALMSSSIEEEAKKRGISINYDSGEKKEKTQLKIEIISKMIEKGEVSKKEENNKFDIKFDVTNIPQSKLTNELIGFNDNTRENSDNAKGDNDEQEQE